MLRSGRLIFELRAASPAAALYLVRSLRKSSKYACLVFAHVANSFYVDPVFRVIPLLFLIVASLDLAEAWGFVHVVDETMAVLEPRRHRPGAMLALRGS